MPLGLATGLIISMVVTLALSAMIAYLVLNEAMKEEAIGYGAMATVLLASSIGSLVSVLRVKRRRFLTCVAFGCCYYLALLSMTALFFGGQYQGMGVTGLLIFAGVGVIALMGLKRESSAGKRRKKYRSR